MARPKMACTLRQATRADIPATHAVRMSVRENQLTGGVITERDYVEHLEALGRGWVIEAAGRIVAFASEMRRAEISGPCLCARISNDADSAGVCSIPRSTGSGLRDCCDYGSPPNRRRARRVSTNLQGG